MQVKLLFNKYNFIKIVSVIIILVFTLAALAGCTAKPVSMKDAKGNIVVLEKRPVDIISLTLITDEILLSITDKANIAALSSLSADPGMSNVIAEAEGVEKVMGSEVEKIISLQPDLLFAADWTDAKTVSQLTDAGIKVFQFTSPNSVDEIKQLIKDIAALISEVGKGDKLIAWMDTKLGYVNDRLAGLTEDQKLKVMSCDSFFFTHGKGTSFDDIAAHAGLINLAAEAGMEKWVQIQKENIIEMNPDALFLPSWSYEGFDAVRFVDDFKSDKSLETVKAVQDGRVYSLSEAHMSSCSQNIVLGVEDAAKAAYPDLFK